LALTNTDRIFAIQGKAGVGKTTVLETIKIAAERAGFAVRGFAPPSGAANLLKDAGINADTVTGFLGSRIDPRQWPTLYILDEAGLADTEMLSDIFNRLRPVDRLLLVGDTEQLKPIGAGAPYKALQDFGMRTGHVDEIMRQIPEDYRAAVEKLSQHQVREGLQILVDGGRAVEIEDDRERWRYATMAQIEEPDSLIVTATNAERIAQNRNGHEIREALGLIDQTNHTKRILTNQSRTKAQRRSGQEYKVGDVIHYHEGSAIYGIGRGEYWTVSEVSRASITVASGDREVTYNPARLSGVSVYKEEYRDFAIGDRIKFTSPMKKQGIATGDFAYIAGINGDQFTVELAKDNREIKIDMGRAPHIDLGYTITTMSSQGQGAKLLIFSVNTNDPPSLNTAEAAYVGVSRGKEQIVLLTNSIQDMIGAFENKQRKENAIDALNQSIAYNREPAQIEQEQPDHKYGPGYSW
jgi:ATP-dependent exoDNAse (exonuclease V) alpha subunit